MLEIVTDRMEKAVKDFYNVTKLKVSFYDKERNMVYSYPEENKRFCAVVGNCKELEKECRICDNKAMDICQKTGKPYIYTCHMNLLEGVNPIMISGEVAGFVILGQKIEKGHEDEIKRRIFEVSKMYEVDGSLLLSGMDELDKTEQQAMEAAMNVMMMCTSHLYRHRVIIKRGDDVPSYQIEEYLYANLSGDLSIPTICKHFHISKSKLYNISKQAFGIGFSDYVRKIRIWEGKKALKNTTKSVNQIAEEVGFSDANYFIRVFRQEEGISPNKYRKLMQKEPD